MKNVKLPFIITIACLIVMTVIVDHEMADTKFQTARVTQTILQQPSIQAGGLDGFEPWLLQVKFDNKKYQFAVTRAMWSNIAVGDRVLIKKKSGFVTGYTYYVTLYTNLKD